MDLSLKLMKLCFRILYTIKSMIYAGILRKQKWAKNLKNFLKNDPAQVPLCTF